MESPDEARVDMRVRPGDDFHYIRVTPEYWLAQKVVVESSLDAGDVLTYPDQPDELMWRSEFNFGGGPRGGAPATKKTKLRHPEDSNCSHSIALKTSASPTNSYIRPSPEVDVHNFSCQ